MKQEKKEMMLKPYTLTELSGIYGVSYSTMKRWLRNLAAKIGERNGRYYSTKQVDSIFNELGMPKTIFF